MPSGPGKTCATAAATNPRDPLCASPSWSWIVGLKALLIVAAGTFVLSPGFRGTWYGDDDIYLLANPLLFDPHGLWKAWFQPGSIFEYYPLEETVRWYEWKLWGLQSPVPYLIVNLALHLTSALLLWRLLGRLGLRLAWLGGLIFAIHPIVVDTVIGGTGELKNTLSLPPYLLAMCFYLDFEESRRPKDYLLALLLFTLAMLGKITMDFFPVTILLYAWWKRGRVAAADVKASLPFFLISLVLVWATMHARDIYGAATHYQNPVTIHLGGFLSRLALAGLSLTFYLGHFLFPLNPMPLYPMWRLDPLTPWLFLPWVAIIVVIACCWKNRRGWGRPVLFGLAFFVLGMAPFLGMNEVSYMSFSWVYDHLVYLQMVALVGLLIAGIERVANLLPRRFLTSGIALLTLALGLIGLQSYSYASLFADQEQLWRYNLRFDPGMWLLYDKLAGVLYERKDFAEAQAEIDEAIRINPDFCNAYLTRAMILFSSGHLTEAIDALQDSVRVNPHYLEGRSNLAFMLSLAHRFPEAIDNFQILLQDQPDSSAARVGLGQALGAENRIPEAVEQLEMAHRLDPANDKISQLLGQAKAYAASQPPKP